MSFKIKFIQLEGQKYRNKFYSAFFKEVAHQEFWVSVNPRAVGMSENPGVPVVIRWA